MAELDLSILIPIYNDHQTLAATLESLVSQSWSGACEWILIDDGSTDASAQLAQAFVADHPQRAVFIQQPNGGEATALNAGWRRARGRLVAIVEADVELAPDWLERCLGILEAEPSATAVGGWLVTPRSDPWVARLAGYEVESKLESLGREVQHLTSAQVVYRAEAFAKAGPFPEALVNASLDAVFNARLRAAGGRLIFEPQARALHHYKTSVLGYLRRHYSYARYRVLDQALLLYPDDRWLLLQVLLALCVWALLLCAALLGLLAGILSGAKVFCLWAVLAAAAMGSTSLLLYVPKTARLWWRHRDPALWVFPLLAFLRNSVASVGAALALLRPVKF